MAKRSPFLGIIVVSVCQVRTEELSRAKKIRTPSKVARTESPVQDREVYNSEPGVSRKRARKLGVATAKVAMTNDKRPVRGERFAVRSTEAGEFSFRRRRWADGKSEIINITYVLRPRTESRNNSIFKL